MKRIGLKVLALAGLAFGAQNASADVICTGCEHINGALATYLGTYNPTTFDVGTFTNTNIFVEEGANTAFTNYWVFDVQPGGNGSISANFTSAASINNFRGSLYNDSGVTNCLPLGGTPTNTPSSCLILGIGSQIGVTQTGNNWEIVATDLAAGRYIIAVQGTTRNSPPSAYSGQLAFNVPEPATLALMGLGLIGFGARVRRQGR